MNPKKHNGIISIWKFIFAICILFHHASGQLVGPDDVQVLRNFAIGVNFFFIVSGFLLAKSALQKSKEQTEFFVGGGQLFTILGVIW